MICPKCGSDDIRQLGIGFLHTRYHCNNIDCCVTWTEWQQAEIAALKARLSELEEHERQTHETLGSILGTDDSLERCARRIKDRLSKLDNGLKDIESRASRTKISPTGSGMGYFLIIKDCAAIAKAARSEK